MCLCRLGADLKFFIIWMGLTVGLFTIVATLLVDRATRMKWCFLPFSEANGTVSPGLVDMRGECGGVGQVGLMTLLACRRCRAMCFKVVVFVRFSRSKTFVRVRNEFVVLAL